METGEAAKFALLLHYSLTGACADKTSSPLTAKK